MSLNNKSNPVHLPTGFSFYKTTVSLKITIQGIEGCFHDAAARQYFEGQDIIPVACETFENMFDRLCADPSLLGIVAIENTIAGSILPNHELLRKSHLTVVGEHKMRISHVLCALPGQSIEELTEVNSHPMALMQCEEYLRLHPNLRKVEKFDTAGSAQEIARENLKGHAAVCGKYAAQLYGLEILQEGIETNKRNFTRFLIVAHDSAAKSLRTENIVPDKSSIEFTLPHTQGALAKVLTIFSFYDINLSKIQSLPVIGREWEYRFYVDLTFDDVERYRQSLNAVKPLTSDFHILGEYNECKTPVD